MTDFEGYKRNPDGSFVDKEQEEHRQSRIKHYYDTIENSYVPDLSDLFVGYECMRCMYSSHIDGSPGKRYCEQTLSLGALRGLDDGRLSDGMWHDIRTMYLTKGQLEKDGWVTANPNIPSHIEIHTHTKDGWMLEFNSTPKEPNHRIVYLSRGPRWYNGNCKSINEFRKVFKWLNIG